MTRSAIAELKPILKTGRLDIKSAVGLVQTHAFSKTFFNCAMWSTLKEPELAKLRGCYTHNLRTAVGWWDTKGRPVGSTAAQEENVECTASPQYSS